MTLHYAFKFKPQLGKKMKTFAHDTWPGHFYRLKAMDADVVSVGNESS